ncbi:MAG: glycosyltransferase family 4 protein [Actinomycetota bacterium]|nr:glycosyltransferase family 4 protein [Actinomycetota bacterium]
MAKSLQPRQSRPLRVAFFTTSYPRHEGDFAGLFVHKTVEQLRARGLEVEVVGPGSYNDHGLTSGDGGGLVANAKRRPWAVPLLLVSMVRELRRAARGVDLVHANWLAGGLVARFAGRPFVVTLHGSGSAGRFQDLELARRAPRFVRFVLRRARAVICCSEALATAMHGCGLDNVHEIPYGVDIPGEPASEHEPPTVLYAGRLSEEKRIDVVAEATEGLPRIVAGDGPLRHLLPDTLGFVSPEELAKLYERAAVVVLVSEREGLPNVVLEAMAYGKTVVATPVGGIPTVIEDGVTGLLVPVGDAAATREAVERALGDPDLRRRLGEAARRRVTELCSWDRVVDRTLAVYAEAVPGAGQLSRVSRTPRLRRKPV